MTTRILTVCLGNICRSPTAEGVLKGMAEARGIALEVDSAGTSAAHLGEPPDLRARETAAQHGFDLSDQRARQVTKADFTRFDLILAMDGNTLFKLQSIAPPNATAELKTYLGAAGLSGDVPDPYYTGAFEDCFALIAQGSEALLARIRKS